MKLIAPHICRTLAISDALDINSVHSEMLERTLDSLLTGVYFTAQDGRVVYMNAAAERQTKDRRFLSIVHDRITPANHVARGELAAAIENISRFDLESPSLEHSLAIPAEHGSIGYVATLLPIAQGRRGDVFRPYSASVAVFIKDPEESAMMPGEAFARLYGLTGAELRVVLATAQVHGGKEAAELLGITEPTVRTHLQRIYAKTETTRLAELLPLLQKAIPPVKASTSRLALA